MPQAATLHRAYSFVSCKGFDPERRTFSGLATSPEPDRVGDVIDPEGVSFRNPLPLLLHHDSRKPVGEARFGRPSKKGITFDARISTIDKETGAVRERLDEAVDSLSADPPLIRGVSIGFRSLEPPTFIKETGGYRFTSIEVMELSMVVIPAQQEATITTLKSLDIGRPAATGTADDVTQTSPGVSGSARVVKARTGPNMKKTIAEQIQQFEATRQAKSARMDEILAKSADTGETLNAEEQVEHDELADELKAIDQHLVRLRAAEERAKAAAVQAKGATTEEGLDTRGTKHQVRVTDNAPGDLEFCRMVLCKAAAYYEFTKGNIISPIDIARRRYPDHPRIQQYMLAKSAVIGGTTTDANTHAALLATAQSLEEAFLAFLRPRTIVGKFGTNGVPSLKRVPFNVKIASQTTGASASWVGEGKPKPVTKFQTASTTLLFTKIAAICVITDELARFSSPGAEGVVRDELSRAVIERMDIDFIDPAKAESSGVNPASITNGVTALTSAGVSAANVLTDLQNLIAPFLRLNYDISDLVLIMPNSLALVLSLMENSLGQPAFAGIGINGGTLRGIPVITSNHAASGASFGNMAIAVSASNIALADDGSVTVDASREASIQMDDAPTQDATAGTGASLVSMYQTNSIALRAEREVNWKKLRATAVTFMDDVNWGTIGSPV